MENSRRFAKTAVAGGYKVYRGNWRVIAQNIHKVLLDRDAWTAVGRAVDTGIEDSAARRGEYVSFDKFDWRLGWIGFTHLLADGKTIDEALGEVLPG